MKRLCLLILSSWAFVSSNVAAEDWQYTVRPGDDIWTLARQFCGSARKADDIAQHNEIPDPKNIRAGTRISIPVNWLAFAPSAARLIAVSDGVRRTDLTGAQLSANVGDVIEMDERIETAAGTAVVEFADGSILAIEPNSDVLFNKLTVFGPAGMVDTHLRFYRGRGNAKVQPQNQGDRFRIQTPEGIAAVRGTQFRVGRQAHAQRSTTETLTGLVEYQQASSSASLPQGFGVLASSAGITKEALLPAPAWQSEPLTLGQGTKLEWPAVSGAKRYSLAWALKSTPQLIVERVSSDQPQALVTVSPGSYLVKVRAASANGIEGYDAARPIVVKSAPPNALSAAVQETGRVLLTWQDTGSGPYQVNISGNDGTRNEQSEERQLALTLPAGNYQWSVASQLSAPSASHTFTVLPATPTGLQVRRNDKQLQLTWDGTPDATEYLLHISNGSGEPIELQTTDNFATVEVATKGPHQITLVSQQNSLQSKPLQKRVNITSPNWWLLLLFLPFLAV